MNKAATKIQRLMQPCKRPMTSWSQRTRRPKPDQEGEESPGPIMRTRPGSVKPQERYCRTRPSWIRWSTSCCRIGQEITSGTAFGDRSCNPGGLERPPVQGMHVAAQQPLQSPSKTKPPRYQGGWRLLECRAAQRQAPARMQPKDDKSAPPVNKSPRRSLRANQHKQKLDHHRHHRS